jgi:Mrp family chromosome partitioning ATPase
MTSVVHGEGKSLSSYNLAIASARAGKRTLLVEADLRSPSNAESIYIKVDPDHQAEPLRYYGSFSECIRLVPEVENLYIVPSVGPAAAGGGGVGIERNAAVVRRCAGTV